MASPVCFFSLGAGATESDSVLQAGLARVSAALGLDDGSAGAEPWAIKVDMGPPNRPSALAPAWVRAFAARLGAGAVPRGSFAFDTLSITTTGLAEMDSHLQLAETKGFASDKGQLPYLVADGPDQGSSLVVDLPPESTLSDYAVAGGLRDVRNLCIMTPVRPHPHLGLWGALASLGVGFGDREGKIALHRDIRPQVDTPLCAGCGTCLTVCLFDAIKIQAGRAYIDHTLCTGCGECMNVCFMAGIAPQEAQGVSLFQVKVADAARAARDVVSGSQTQRQLYGNFLVRPERRPGGALVSGLDQFGDVGVLVGRDPVAVDQATFDLICEQNGGELGGWSGFKQVPAALLSRASAIGLGQTDYKLVTV